MSNFLKRLELQGFKSFAVKTSLEFPARVTAIVGPNGSGKSNIIDALRWALGERGAKELRGETFENLIFAGTSRKSAVGLAKVGLCFDNYSKLFSEDCEEVMLVRRIDRSGNSQFFWNDSEIKLKDLIPILARVKLGSRGLTMIGQGQSDLFVKSSSEERRMMIEEILGLREFRLKKEQAERRLEISEINAEKARNLVQELSHNLRFLRRQRERFQKRNEIEIKLKELENKYFSFYYQEINEGLKKLDEPIISFGKDQNNLEHRIKVLEKEINNLNKMISVPKESQILREQVNKKQDERLNLERELVRLETRIELQFQNSNNAVSSGEAVTFLNIISNDVKEAISFTNLGEVKKFLENLLNKLQKFFKNDKEPENQILIQKHKEIKDEINKFDVGIKYLREKEISSAENQDKFNQEFRKKIELFEAKKSELRNIEQKKQNLLFEKEKLNLRLEELERRWNSLGRVQKDLKEISSAEGDLEKSTDWAEIDKKIMRFSAELAAIGEIDPGLVKEADESENRYQFLNNELTDLEKATIDLKTLIRELESKIHDDFQRSFRLVNDEFNKYFRLMFRGGKAKLVLKKRTSILKPELGEENHNQVEVQLVEEKKDLITGVEIELNLPSKKISSLEMLSGGEKSLVSMAALFALIAVSPPPFLVLDEIDAALDEENARRFSELIKEFAKKTQFIIVTHNRATMEAADVLYGITLGEDGTSKVLSLKLE